MHEPKTARNEHVLDVLSDNSVNTPSFKNLNNSFLSIVHRWRKCSNIRKVPFGGGAEIENLKVCNFFTFSISAPPPEGVLIITSHF